MEIRTTDLLRLTVYVLRKNVRVPWCRSDRELWGPYLTHPPLPSSLSLVSDWATHQPLFHTQPPPTTAHCSGRLLQLYPFPKFKLYTIFCPLISVSSSSVSASCDWCEWRNSGADTWQWCAIPRAGLGVCNARRERSRYEKALFHSYWSPILRDADPQSAVLAVGRKFSA